MAFGIGNMISGSYALQHGATNTLLSGPRPRGAPSEGRARDKLEEEKRRLALARTIIGGFGGSTLGGYQTDADGYLGGQ